MKKYDDLLVFVTVVERMSFVGAARQLGLPPGTVSRKVQELEARLGVTLLNRTTRSLSVTEAGREVYESAARGFAAIEEAESVAARHHETPSGVLRIISPYALLYTALLPLAPEFRALYPEVRLEFVVTNQQLDLVEHGCDLAFRVGAQPDSTYVKRTILEPGYWLVGNRAALDRFGVPRKPADLLNLPMSGLVSISGVTTASPIPSTWTFVKGDRREEMNFQFSIAGTDPIVPLDFALRGNGLAIVLETLARQSVEAGLLEIVLPDWSISERLELSLIYRPRATMDSKLRVFVEFIAQRLRRDPRLK